MKVPVAAIASLLFFSAANLALAQGYGSTMSPQLAVASPAVQQSRMPDPPFYPHETVSEDGTNLVMAWYKGDGTCEMGTGPMSGRVYTFWSTCRWEWAGSEFRFTLNSGASAGKPQPKNNGNLIGLTPARGPFKQVSMAALETARAQAEHFASSCTGRHEACIRWCNKHAAFSSNPDLFQKRTSWGTGGCAENTCMPRYEECKRTLEYRYGDKVIKVSRP